MIEPAVSGPALAGAIRTERPPMGTVHMWRLGQAGVALNFDSATVLVDPYLSNHCEALLGPPFDHRRMTRAPLDPVDLDRVDLVICSHEHPDHFDVPTLRTLARQNSQANILAPARCRSALLELGWHPDQILAGDDCTDFEVFGLQVHSFAVPHETFDEGPDGSAYLGFTISDAAVTVAHLGDCMSHFRVVDALLEHPVDVLFAPINGRDEYRASLGFAGNMTAAEAVTLAASAQARVLVPVHYDMFAQNVDLGALDLAVAEGAAQKVDVTVLEVGARNTVTGAAASGVGDAAAPDAGDTSVAGLPGARV